MEIGARGGLRRALALQRPSPGRRHRSIVREKSLELWQRLWEPTIATLLNVQSMAELPLVAVGDNRIGKVVPT